MDERYPGINIKVLLERKARDLNKLVAVITGYSLPEIPRDPSWWTRVAYQEDRDKLMEIKERLEREEVPCGPYQVRWRHRKGNLVWTELWVLLEKDHAPQGEVAQFMALVRDVTGQKNLEWELELRNRELELVNQVAYCEEASGSIKSYTALLLELFLSFTGAGQGGVFWLTQEKPLLSLSSSNFDREKGENIILEKWPKDNHSPVYTFQEEGPPGGEWIILFLPGDSKVDFGVVFVLFNQSSRNRWDIYKERLIKEALSKASDILKRKRIEEELIKTKERLQEAQRIARLGSWEWDISRDRVYWSEGLYHLLGLEPGEIYPESDTFLDYVHPGDRQLVAGALQDVLQKKHLNIEHRYINVMGEEGWLYLQGKVTGDLAGNCNFMFVTAQDITGLKQAEKDLRDSEEKFRYMAEFSPFPLSIINDEGRYEYLNPSFIKIFGYNLLDIPTGKDWFKQAFPNPTSRVNAISSWKSDLEKFKEGKSLGDVFSVTCKNGVIRDILIRAVRMKNNKFLVIYEDVTEQRRSHEQLKYLSYHDNLTGLYNRAFFENELNRLDTERQLPLSLIIGDANGLKLVNDAFGHMEGDLLLKRIARILKDTCRSEDIICRWGGDEFAILLPRTGQEFVQGIIKRIKKACSQAEPYPIKLSIALGSDTKDNPYQDLEEVLKKAESEMYRQKLSEAKEFRNSVIASLIKILGEKDYETEEHSWRMQNLAVQLGTIIHLKDGEMDDLVLAVALHDIGKIAVPEELLLKPGPLTPEEWETVKEHSERGYRIALSATEMAHLAPVILHHHECWDGSGYPMGLKGEDIPLLSRIIAVVDAYDVMTHGRPYKKSMSKKEALGEIKDKAGKQFDPAIARVFIKNILG